MAKPLSVLIVEDTESDAQLIVRMFKKAGYSLTFEQVESAAQMRAALEKQAWEIVISDFSMPELDGFAALKVLQETGRDIPFIVVSGTMGEDTAVAMMKAGAHDYVMKGNLTRLVPAVKRELIQAKERLERKQVEAALQLREQQHRTLLQTAMDGFWLLDRQGKLLEVNATYCRMSGYTEQELLSMHVSDLESKETVNETATHIQKVLERGEDRFESRHRRKDGSSFDVEISVQYRAEKGGRLVAFLQDITERKRTEEALRESHELLSLFIKHSPIYAFIKAVTASESRVLNVSDNIQGLTGFPASEMVGKTNKNLFPADFAAKITSDDWAVVSNGVVLRLDEDLNDRYYNTIKFPIIQGDKTLLAGYTIDITERKRAEEQIRASLQEKEVLLQEIHHRVKNNLQIISGLLTLQADQTAGKSLDDIFRASQDRIRSMALIHEKLYSSHNLAEIAFDEYLRALTENLFASQGIVAGRITVKYELEPIMFAIEKAIPLGLIANELVTNTLKHAFPAGQQGEIRIELHGYKEAKSYNLKTDSGTLHIVPTCELIIADNGVGLPAGFKADRQKSLGMHLLSMLAQQIQAELKVKTGPGTEFRLIFPGLPASAAGKDKLQ